MELASIETIKKFVSIGMGISIVPMSYVRSEMEQGTLRLVAIKNVKLVRKLGLIYRKNRYVSRACRAFLEIVEESLGPERPSAQRRKSSTILTPLAR